MMVVVAAVTCSYGGSARSICRVRSYSSISGVVVVKVAAEAAVASTEQRQVTSRPREHTLAKSDCHA